MKVMKKVVKLLFTVVIGILFLFSADVNDTYAANATVSFGSNYYSKECGEEFPIGVYVKSDMGVGIHAIRLRYDTSKLQYISGATKEANGVILLKGNGGSASVKYWLQFKAIAGGEAKLESDVAKVYINNNTQLINITSLPKAPINIEGGTALPGMSDMIESLNGEEENSEDDTMKAADNNEDDTQSTDSLDSSNINYADTLNQENNVVDNSMTSNTDEQDVESNNEEEEYGESEDLGTEESDNKVKDKEKKESNFVVSVLINLLIFVGSTAVGILIINAITNKGKKARLQQEFEDEYRDEYRRPYNPPVDNSYRTDNYGNGNYSNGDYNNGNYSNGDYNNGYMSPMPMDGFSDREYNRQDNAISYNPSYQQSQNQIDVEFVCNNSPIEELGQQQQYQQQMQQGAREHFDYIEQNLERSLEEQLKQQMDNYY